MKYESKVIVVVVVAATVAVATIFALAGIGWKSREPWEYIEPSWSYEAYAAEMAEVERVAAIGTREEARAKAAVETARARNKQHLGSGLREEREDSPLDEQIHRVFLDGQRRGLW